MAIICRVFNCDNHLRITVNGVSVYDKYYDLKINIHDEIVLDSFLKKPEGQNVIIVTGHNGPILNYTGVKDNPWRFNYTIEKDGNKIAGDDYPGPAYQFPEYECKIRTELLVLQKTVSV